MEALRARFEEEGLVLPDEMLTLMEEEEVGAVGRRRVYGRLYGVWRAATGGKGRVVWPLELREAVREKVAKDGEEGPAGKYDSQHENSQSATHITIADLARLDWRCRPAQPSKRKAESSASGSKKYRKCWKKK